MLSLARLLVIVGLILILTGGVIYLISRSGIQAGDLPGDIKIQRGNLTCIVGLGISVVLSILLTIILNVVVRLLNK